jgi:uncharacterized protein (TIRG00374 family)
VIRDPGAPDERRAISKRSIIIGLAIGIPVSLLFLWLAVRGVDVGEVWAALSRADIVLVLVAVPFILMLYVTQGLRWRHLVIAPSLPRRRAFVVLMFVGLAITNVVPGRPGDVARGAWLSRLGPIPMARSLTSVGVDRALDVGTVFTVLLLCLPFVDSPDWLITLVIVGAAVSVVALAVLITAWVYGRDRRCSGAATRTRSIRRTCHRHRSRRCTGGGCDDDRPHDPPGPETAAIDARRHHSQRRSARHLAGSAS